MTKKRPATITPSVASVTSQPPPLPPPEWLTALIERHGKSSVTATLQELVAARERQHLRDTLLNLSPDQMREALLKWLL